MGSRVLKLSEAREGGVYRVARVEGTGLVKRRILDLGIIPGSIVRVVRRAPLGDPIEVVVRGYPVSVRSSEAEHVIVEEVK
ncbi:ferrous iron transport protein A [Desulfurococcaceae archaeon MEX13E-LK6-19]|nr:ferrous iron transport protein A [Desulfurococcaceae archaeon MEX13E-LK6-19]